MCWAPGADRADLVTLASAILPNKDEALAQFFKVPLNDDGFFVEKHAKLGPRNLPPTACFLCGMAHYPKPIDEAIAQGRAAASRAITLLAKETINTSGTVAETEPSICSSAGCASPSAPIRRHHSVEADERIWRQGPDQSGAVQGLRPVRGLLPLWRHSSKRIRQRSDLCTDLLHERSDISRLV
jgi:heterodisulfide reductase subunit A-like polyferredoxin